MRIALLVPALALALAPAMARAEGADGSTADALFREGRRAADAGEYAVACPKFEESYRLEPAPGTLLNLGDCEENRGQLARAAQHFRQLYEQLPPTDERRPIAEARARALELRAAKLRAVPVATVPSSAAKPPAAVEPATPAPAPDANVQRTAAFVVGGVGIATFVTGTILGVVALSHLASANAACTGNVCASQDAVSQFHGAQSFAIVADVTIGVGLAFIGTAIFLALMAPHAAPSTAAGSMPTWMGGRF